MDFITGRGVNRVSGKGQEIQDVVMVADEVDFKWCRRRNLEIVWKEDESINSAREGRDYREKILFLERS